MKINKGEDDYRDRKDLERLHALLVRYAQGDCTPEEQQAVEEWYETLSGDRETQPSEEFSAKQRMWARIRRVIQFAGETPVKVTKPHQRQWLRWAASIALLWVSFLFGYVFIQKQQPLPIDTHASEKNWVIEMNTTSEEKRLLLADGSRITLKSNASVRYPETFGDSERLVKLDGEAFFEIEKDVTRPFKVLTGNITTRVLGTSFNVKAIEEQSFIEVDVRSGKVSVYEHNHADSANTEGVVLTPNQKVTYYKKEKKWVPELVSDPVPVPADIDQVSSFVFRDDQMRNVLQRIASRYGVEIIVVNDAVNDCPFTGDLSQMELYDMLKLICKSVGSEYEVRGTRILIDGAGCP